MNNITKALKVPLKWHWSTILLPAILWYTNGILTGTVCFIIILLSLLFHEYCHVWMAIRQNMECHRVEVFALGAAAMVDSEKIMYDPLAGLKVAAAGPLGSVFLALIGLPLFLLFPNFVTIYFFIINVMFAIFNLLPLFPSDGGRIVYSLLSYKMPFRKAINIAIAISVLFSVAGIVLSLIYASYWMVVMFVFIVLFVLFAFQQRQAFIRKMEMDGIACWTSFI